MADDTRLPAPTREDLSKEALTVDPSAKPFAGAQWGGAKENETYKPPANANAMAGGTQHTAGGQMPQVSIGKAFEGGLKMQDFYDLPKKPCVRDSLLTGIGVGFALGGLGLVFRSTIWRASNITAFTFCGSAGIQYQWCLYNRQREKEGMMRAVDILNKKEVEKKAREQQREKAKEARRKLKEAEQDQQIAELKDRDEGGGKSSWKFW